MAGNNKRSKRPDKPASNSNSNSGGGDFIIPFKIPKPNESKLKAKFTDDDEEEVEEVVQVFHEGDKDYNLIVLMKQIIELGDTYDLWTGGKTKKLAQVLARALNGKPRSKWTYLMSERVTWTEPGGMRKPLIRMFQELSTELFGDDAFQKHKKR